MASPRPSRRAPVTEPLQPLVARNADGGLRGLDRALTALEAIAKQRMRPAELSQSLGVPWTSVHRLVTHFAARGFLVRDAATGQYRIGQAAWLVGSSYLVNHRVLEAARPQLEMFAERTDATVQLCEPAGRLVITLFSHHRAAAESIVKATVGYHFPLHCGAKGQVLLAFAPTETRAAYLVAPLERLTSETLTDPAAIAARLSEIRHAGYASTQGDVQPFTGSVAAPVFDETGRAVASIALIMRRSAFDDVASIRSLTEALLAVAETVSSSLGWRPGLTAPPTVQAEAASRFVESVAAPRASKGDGRTARRGAEDVG